MSQPSDVRRAGSGALDPSVLQGLGEALDDVDGEFVRGLAAVYETEALELVEQLSDAEQASDLPRIKFVAHSLKGSSANVGGHRLVSLCAALEPHGPSDQVTPTAATFRTELAALLEELRAFVRR